MSDQELHPDFVYVERLEGHDEQPYAADALVFHAPFCARVHSGGERDCDCGAQA